MLQRMTRALVGLLLSILVLVALLVLNTVRNAPRPRVPARDDSQLAIEAVPYAQHLAAAVRFETVSHQDPAADDRAVFAAFRGWLEATYPRVHTQLARTLINGDALLYEWPGSNPKLAPILFLAHQDVVPVEPASLASWSHPPFAGEIADGYVWGRGAIDDKSSLICLFEAFEALLGRGFKPTRTIYLASGFDEEVGGKHGAVAIADELAARGKRLHWLVDEGGGVTEGVVADVKRPVATIAISEKGYLSLALVAHGQGGHSSMPPYDSAVSKLVRTVARVEASPFEPRMTSTLRESLQRLAPEMPFFKRMLASNMWLTESMILRRMSYQEHARPQVRTTIAPTMLEAGIKDNVVPSTARAVVNFRILPGESIASVTAHVKKAVRDPQVSIEPLDQTVSEPAPLSPVDGPGFELLERVIQEHFPDAVVVPSVVNGATDARHFRKITNAAYRFVPRVLRRDDLPRIHGTDERASVAGLALAVRAYSTLIERGAAR
jgi:carboxypeptidase PM20D1